MYINSRTYPALNIIGGRRYMKNSSSSNLRMWELFHLVRDKIITPDTHPWWEKINTERL